MSDQEFWGLLEAAPDAMVVVNTDGEIVLVNGQTERLFGYSRAEMLGQGIEMLLPERFRVRHAGHFARYAGAPGMRAMGSNLELFGRRRDGSEVPVEISLSPVRTEHGLFLSSSIRDVTDRKRTEATMRMLSSLVESSSDAIVSYTVEGAIMTWNAGAEAMFGYTAQEAVGRSATLILGDADSDVCSQLDAGNPVRLLETDGYRKDGSTVAISLSVSFVYDADGAKIGVSCIARDVSEIKRRQAEAEADRARLIAAQQAAHVGSFEIDMRTGDRWWSAEYWRIIGVANTQPASRELMLTSVHPDDRERVEAVWLTLDSGGRASDFGYRIVRPSGEVRWVRSLTSFEYAEDGSPARILGTTMDVTDLHLADVQRREAETNFQLGFNLSPIGIGVADLEGQFQRVNPAVCEIFGRSEMEILGRRAEDFLHQDDVGSISVASSHMQSNEAETAHVEKRYLRPDGVAVWVQETVSFVPGLDDGAAHLFMQLQDITSRKLAEADLEYQAFHDPLTGLANRLLLTKNLERSLVRAKASGGQVSVLFLDVDQFKVINDGLGHTAGDGLLVQLAKRLQSMVRLTDTLARFGGDEFVIVCENITRENTERLVERIVASGKDPFVLEGQDVFATVSVGIVLASADEDTETVLRNSDAAMYDAKNRGRAQAMMFSEEMHTRASSRLDLESQLARALDHNELRVYYQPIVDVSTEGVVGFEALVRWAHPIRGLISPLEFIPIAEQTGMIIPIGEWVLREALAQAQKWRTEIPGAAALSISVNFSVLQLQDPDFVAVVADALTRSGLAPTALHLEITESVMMNDIEAAAETLNALHALGVRLSLDDFGTGHASLGHLDRLPVQTIKIDRSFVGGLGGENPKAASIVQAIVNLARSLDLDVVAEGVETVEQLLDLRRIGARLAQGFLWSRPLPPQEIPQWLMRASGRAASQAPDAKRPQPGT
ncbi:sensor domain-containing protein [Cryobacterium tagatosivorans]|nr:EAL domain-containing protein [Cryobacterium tagatosivorans]